MTEAPRLSIRGWLERLSHDPALRNALRALLDAMDANEYDRVQRLREDLLRSREATHRSPANEWRDEHDPDFILPPKR